MEIVDYPEQVSHVEFPDRMFEGTLPQSARHCVQFVVPGGDLPVDLTHQVADGNVVLSGDDQVKVVAHDDIGMELDLGFGANVEDDFKDHILLRGSKQETTVSGSVPDMVGVVIADGTSLGDAQPPSARI